MNGVTQLLTFVMIFVVNHTQWYDTIAINTKLDALILAVENADNRAIGIEHAAEHVSERLREEIVGAVHGAELAPEA